MRRLAPSAGLLSLILINAVGCAVADDLPEEAPPKDEKVEQKEQPIFGGSPDTGHDAVVYLVSQNGACSGTIIAVNGNYGYILSAGHCDGMVYIIQDDDVNCVNWQTGDASNCDNAWEVSDQIVHPDYDPMNVGNGYDFSLIRFTGANASTPVIPAATSPDGLSVGTVVEHVGFGITENSNNNTQRRHVSTPIDQLTSIFLGFDQSSGQGPCSGDSGGPALYNGKVVGVTSYGDEDCTLFGASGRVAAVYNGFIAPYIGGEVVETCETCFDAAIQPNGACDAAVEACIGNEQSECSQLVACLNDCGANGSDACIQACADAHQAGIEPYLAIYECTYCQACSSLCQDECEQLQGSNSTVATTSSSMNGVGGGNSGNGGATGDGGNNTNNSNGGASSEGGSGSADDDAATDGGEEDGCGCATVGAEAPQRSWLGIAGLALAAGAVARRRRRA
ncbi:MAG: trypsin-like serine protease [Polyangiaceae bacterium]|nr:trypsin-like serine protease [Polyangiaceae bacterium]